LALRKRPDQFGIVGAFDDLVRSLADAQTLFRQRLIEGDIRPAAAAAEQHDLLGAHFLLQVFDRGLEVLRHLAFPVDRRFVVDRVGIQPEHDHAALRPFAIDQGADAVIMHTVLDAVDRDHRPCRVGIDRGVRHIERTLRLAVEMHKFGWRKIRALRRSAPSPAGDQSQDGGECSNGS
jgi:hypothetical protein